MTKIYLPLEEGQTYACYVIYDKDTIRAYTSAPAYNTTSNYVDYYINSHYLSRNGTQTWNNYNTLPTCIDASLITSNYYYRNDFSDIMFIFLVISLFCLWLPYKIFSRAFGRWLKL